MHSDEKPKKEYESIEEAMPVFHEELVELYSTLKETHDPNKAEATFRQYEKLIEDNKNQTNLQALNKAIERTRKFTKDLRANRVTNWMALFWIIPLNVLVFLPLQTAINIFIVNYFRQKELNLSLQVGDFSLALYATNILILILVFASIRDDYLRFDALKKKLGLRREFYKLSVDEVFKLSITSLLFSVPLLVFFKRLEGSQDGAAFVTQEVFRNPILMIAVSLFLLVIPIFGGALFANLFSLKKLKRRLFINEIEAFTKTGLISYESANDSKYWRLTATQHLVFFLSGIVLSVSAYYLQNPYFTMKKLAFLPCVNTEVYFSYRRVMFGSLAAQTPASKNILGCYTLTRKDGFSDALVYLKVAKDRTASAEVVYLDELKTKIMGLNDTWSKFICKEDMQIFSRPCSDWNKLIRIGKDDEDRFDVLEEMEKWKKVRRAPE